MNYNKEYQVYKTEKVICNLVGTLRITTPYSNILNEYQTPPVTHLSKLKQKQYKLIFQAFSDVLVKDKNSVGDFFGRKPGFDFQLKL